MARIWLSGFELQSVTAGVEWSTVVGSPTINTTIKRSGAASLRANPSGATAYVTKQIQANGGSNYIYVRAWVYIASAPAGLTTILKLPEDLDVAGDGCSIRLNANRTLEFWDDSDPVQLGSDSSALALDTWHMIEVHVATDGDSLEARLNGTEFASGAGMAGIVLLHATFTLMM